MEQRKIVDLISECESRGTKFASFEIIPEVDVDLGRFVLSQDVPLFFSVVWKTKVDWSTIKSDNLSSIPAVRLAERLVKLGKTVLVHIACVNVPKDKFFILLEGLKKLSVKNLLLLRGDEAQPSRGEGSFEYVQEAIIYVREKFGDHFCIGTTGFPDIRDLRNMQFLKLKIKAGARFIVTQLFFDIGNLMDFITRCREAGIETPIVPGICLFASYKSLVKMAEFTKVRVPPALRERAASDAGDFGSLIRDYYGEQLEGLNERRSLVPGIHWFTMNNIDPVVNFYGRYKFTM